ncbi:hypothetical protein CR513_35611, partial [Mucuna pruriens]
MVLPNVYFKHHNNMMKYIYLHVIANFAMIYSYHVFLLVKLRLLEHAVERVNLTISMHKYIAEDGPHFTEVAYRLIAKTSGRPFC